MSSSQQAKLIADDGDRLDSFGSSVAVSSDGTMAIISAKEDEDPNGDNAGSAYVFEASGGSWLQQTKLTAADGDKLDVFGASVAVSSDGTTAIIGASNDEDPNGEYSGSAYVFKASGGSWIQQTKLFADDGERLDNFGVEVAVSSDGTTAIAGAIGDNKSAGSAYVFEASGGSWTQQAKLTADDGDRNDIFGSSVAMSNDGTTALIGAEQEEDPNGEKSGSAYVFEVSSGSWTQQAKIAPNDGDEKDYFGGSVAVSSDGTTAIIGAESDEGPNGEKSGSTYVFEASAGSWSHRVKLTADDGDGGDGFGSAVAVSSDGTTAIIGADQDVGPYGPEAGSAYVFNL